jgi:hypothetical protein
MVRRSVLALHPGEAQAERRNMIIDTVFISLGLEPTWLKWVHNPAVSQTASAMVWPAIKAGDGLAITGRPQAAGSCWATHELALPIMSATMMSPAVACPHFAVADRR